MFYTSLRPASTCYTTYYCERVSINGYCSE